MRSALTEEKLWTFLEEVGKSARAPGAIFIAGGATAVVLGIRPQTIDIDLKFDPEPGVIFEIISELKEMGGIAWMNVMGRLTISACIQAAT